MWLVVLVPLAVMLCMASKPEKGATEALLHSRNQATMRSDAVGGSAKGTCGVPPVVAGQEFRDFEMEAGGSGKENRVRSKSPLKRRGFVSHFDQDMHLDVAGLREIWLLEVQRRQPPHRTRPTTLTCLQLAV